MPNDNNIAQRNVHPDFHLTKIPWEKLPFWIRHDGKLPGPSTVEVNPPGWLSRLGWSFDMPKLSRERVVMRPRQLLQVTPSSTVGKRFTDQVLEKERDRDIVFTILQDGMPGGGMTIPIVPAPLVKPCG